ncbi:unnamed protein product [Pleuronectes platessa]|uniref:Uncharacterized protein n=1 Tax=Pleuronectes platessa TaxID=8262 RepID=A0A9N7ZBW3_PLEPL|nr:unnamed protein product [Pleuronectes platessa]
MDARSYRTNQQPAFLEPVRFPMLFFKYQSVILPFRHTQPGRPSRDFPSTTCCSSALSTNRLSSYQTGHDEHDPLCAEDRLQDQGSFLFHFAALPVFHSTLTAPAPCRLHRKRLLTLQPRKLICPGHELAYFPNPV